MIYNLEDNYIDISKLESVRVIEPLENSSEGYTYYYFEYQVNGERYAIRNIIKENLINPRLNLIKEWKKFKENI